LKVILGAAKELRRKEGQIVLCSLTKFVKEIFVVSGINSLIPITDSLELGIAQIGVNPV
jgi:anti-anti-sigma factor